MYSFGIPDEAFIRGKVPMTKEEVRVITLSKLKIKRNDIIVDIGAGTGSISIECALLSPEGNVYGVERNKEAVNLIKENIKKFNINNMEIIEGEAPEALSSLPQVNKAVLGGTGGNMEGIMDWIDKNLKEDGTVVINAITVETVYKALEEMKKRKYQFEVILVSISKGESAGNYTLMKGQNPVYIITGKK